MPPSDDEKGIVAIVIGLSPKPIPAMEAPNKTDCRAVIPAFSKRGRSPGCRTTSSHLSPNRLNINKIRVVLAAFLLNSVELFDVKDKSL